MDEQQNDPRDGRQQAGHLTEVRASAKEWHRLQLASLAFIGLCGVIQSGDARPGPLWLQSVAGILVLGALGAAALAIVLVAGVAWPLRQTLEAPPEAARQAYQRLRVGIVLTAVAVGLTALAAAGSWWPDDAAAGTTGASVRVETSTARVCGLLAGGSAAWLDLDIAGERTRIPLADVVTLEPAARC